MKRFWYQLSLLLVFLMPRISLRAGEIQFIEDFALAPDRQKALELLVPGTDEYYYFQSLHLQNSQQFRQVDELLTVWQQRLGETERLQQIRHRQKVLTYGTNARATLDYLIQQLNPNLHHQRDPLRQDPQVPSLLDPKLIDAQTLKQRALTIRSTLEGFTPAALLDLRGTDLDPARRRELLSRLQRPEHPELIEFVLADLAHEGNPGFGSLPIHQQLLLAQLDALVAKRPALKQEGVFVHAYLQKLQPGPDLDWRAHPEEHEAYLARIWKFAAGLNATHNSLKAMILFDWLKLGQSQGKYDRERFLAYLALPRHVGYIEPKLLQNAEATRYPADLNWNPQGAIQLPIINNDEPLVRDFLLYFLKDETNSQRYEPFIQDDYLKQVFAEAKIVAGLGDIQRWSAMLTPEQFQALKDRIDIDFVPTNPSIFSSADPIRLDVDIKNVRQLLVKVYEINTRNYYRQFKKRINTDIELDGLLPNQELSFDYSEGPLLRKRRHFEFPTLTKPGVYVIDFIGNGKSSRVVVHKGDLTYLETTSDVGHVFTLLNDRREKIKDGTLWMDGHLYTSNADGQIFVPYSTNPGRQSIVLSQGDFSALQFFQHQGEAYQLVAPMYVDRESLLRAEDAAIMIRPQLRLGNRPVALSLLEDVKLRIRSVDLDGIASEHVVSDVKLFDDRETPVMFHVPHRLAQLHFELAGRVKLKTTGQPVDVSASHQVEINKIDATDKVAHLHLSLVGKEYLLQLRGKGGEPLPKRHVHVSLRHRSYTDPVEVDLATDGQGMIRLGELKEIDSVSASGMGSEQFWPVRRDRTTLPSIFNVRAGVPVHIPLMSTERENKIDDYSLLEVRGETYVADRSNLAKLQATSLELNGLSPGNYSLIHLPTQRSLAIRVVAGQQIDSFLVGEVRRLEAQRLKPFRLAPLQLAGDKLTVRVDDANPFTRVHVVANRFITPFDPFESLRSPESVMGENYNQTPRSYYMAGRQLGDELRYILDRAYARRFPGNMLERPSMLLNPWPIRDTQTTTQEAQSGDEFAAAADAPKTALAAAAPGMSPSEKPSQLSAGDFANLDFLFEPVMVLPNLKPNADGVIEVDLKDLGTYQQFQVLVVDPQNTAYRTIASAELKTRFRELRLAPGLDPQRHYTQRKEVTILKGGEQFELADVTTSRFDAYESLSRMYSLLLTLSKNEQLKQFEFITRWPQLNAAEQRSKYAEFACHELNFFLYKKDPQFFRDVVRPYLQNKLHKTFLDLWLLEADLTPFLEPWRYSQLNVVERLLLGQRIDGEEGRIRRKLEEQFSLMPRDVERNNVWFETAVNGRALDDSDRFGLVKQEQEKEMTRGFGGGYGGYGYAADAAAAPAEPQADDSTNLPELGLALEAKDAKTRFRGLQRKLMEKSVEEGRRDVLFESLADKNQLALGRLYTKLEKTQEWAENNYYRLLIEAQSADLVSLNAFWHDFARHAPSEPFFSTHWVEAHRNLTEIMFALSLLDVPFDSKPAETKFEDQRMVLTASGPMVVFHEQIREAEVKQDSSILVTENFFRQDDRHQIVQGETRDKFVTDEFLTHVVYGCQVVLTNPTSVQRKVQVLVQIPHQSIPALNGKTTRTVTLDLPPYHTQTVEYHFYFPAPGTIAHFPVHVAQNEVLIGFAAPKTLKVVETPSQVDQQSWDYLSQFATDADLIAFLNKSNLHELDLRRIAFRMRDVKFFEQVVALLQDRHIYQHELWAYALVHDRPQEIATFLRHEPDWLSRCGMALESELLTIDPVQHKTYQHLDYRPLVNARIDRLGKRRQILNDRFYQQYHQFLTMLSFYRELTDEHRMALTYYLLLQDRIEMAMDVFSRVQPGNLETRLQYDYFTAYLDCYRDEPSQARAIAQKYANYPVETWQKAFANVTRMLDEVDGQAITAGDPADRTQAQTAAAADQPNLDFRVEDKKILVNYQNLAEVQINYYLIDLETLFSTNPFMQQFSDRFSHVRPSQSQKVPLAAKQLQQTIELPAELRNRNVVVELVAGPIARSQLYYSNSLNVQVSENFGQLQVLDSGNGKPVTKAYVKTYAEMQDGTIKFFKDGYTDLRGRFDYASLSTNEIDFVKRLSVLVLDDQRGGMVREAQPPKR